MPTNCKASEFSSKYYAGLLISIEADSAIL